MGGESPPPAADDDDDDEALEVELVDMAEEEEEEGAVEDGESAEELTDVDVEGEVVVAIPEPTGVVLYVFKETLDTIRSL